MCYKMKIVFKSNLVFITTFSQSKTLAIWRSTRMVAFHNTDCMRIWVWAPGSHKWALCSPSSYPLRHSRCHLKSCAGSYSVCPTDHWQHLSSILKPQLLGNCSESLLLFNWKYPFIKYNLIMIFSIPTSTTPPQPLPTKLLAISISFSLESKQTVNKGAGIKYIKYKNTRNTCIYTF